jgi:hypothetical protein
MVGEVIGANEGFFFFEHGANEVDRPRSATINLPSISEGRSLVPCFAAISVCVFCELGPKKISFVGDPPKKRGEQEEGHRNQSFNRPGPVLPDSDIPLPLSLYHFSSRQQ